MEKTTKKSEPVLGAESEQKPNMKLVTVDEKTVREFLEKDLKASRDLIGFILSVPEMLDMMAAYAAGAHNNRVNAERAKQNT